MYDLGCITAAQQIYYRKKKTSRSVPLMNNSALVMVINVSWQTMGFLKEVGLIIIIHASGGLLTIKSIEFRAIETIREKIQTDRNEEHQYKWEAKGSRRLLNNPKDYH